MGQGNELLYRGLMLVPLVLSLTVHEWAHAFSAFLIGDDTAARQGRLTLNPLAHIDPIGTIICPLMGIPFGWAKPVPFNPLRFRRGISVRTGTMITKAAGPVSNLLLAIGCAVIYGLLLRAGWTDGEGGLALLLVIAIRLNLALCIFNFLPIPPLDGAGVVEGLIPYRLLPHWSQYLRRGSWVLMGVIVLNSYVYHGALFEKPTRWMLGPIEELVRMVAGLG